MKVGIWDLDWYHKQSFIPNIRCMQLSSYHKQVGDDVSLITDATHVGLRYDCLYIFKQRKQTPTPKKTTLDKPYVKLVGEGFEFVKTVKLSDNIAACRPDYLLYNDSGKYNNADFVSFYNYGRLITLRQDYHNTKGEKKFTIVTDKDFWSASDSDIIYCLEALKSDKNIMFLAPISLQKIVCNTIIREKFLDLSFATGTNFKWRNDFGNSVNAAMDIIEFLKELRKHTKSKLGFIPIKAQLSVDVDDDLRRCFQIIGKFKENKLNCVIIAAKDSPVSFQVLEKWTRTAMDLSYVEYILHPYVLSSGILWYNILNHAIHWRDAKCDQLLSFLADKGWVSLKPLLLLRQGNDYLIDDKVDYKYIRNNINLLYK